MLTVANPIYDVVFKYLMEDERIAKTILSALLKKNVVELEFRNCGHSHTSRGQISMFRTEFAATIEEADGSRHLVQIELQKTGGRPRRCTYANTSVRTTPTRRTYAARKQAAMPYRWWPCISSVIAWATSKSQCSMSTASPTTTTATR